VLVIPNTGQPRGVAAEDVLGVFPRKLSQFAYLVQLSHLISQSGAFWPRRIWHQVEQIKWTSAAAAHAARRDSAVTFTVDFQPAVILRKSDEELLVRV